MAIVVSNKPIPQYKVLLAVNAAERQQSYRPFAYNVLQAMVGQPVWRCKRALRQAVRAGLCTRTSTGNHKLTEAGRALL